MNWIHTSSLPGTTQGPYLVKISIHFPFTTGRHSLSGHSLLAHKGEYQGTLPVHILLSISYDVILNDHMFQELKICKQITLHTIHKDKPELSLTPPIVLDLHSFSPPYMNNKQMIYSLLVIQSSLLLVIAGQFSSCILWTILTPQSILTL